MLQHSHVHCGISLDLSRAKVKNDQLIAKVYNFNKVQYYKCSVALSLDYNIPSWREDGGSKDL